MNPMSGRILIGSILLERNRWANPKTPTYRVSEWLERFEDAGFDGVELWEYHATLATAEEQRALESAAFPLTIFNSYAAFDATGVQDREAAADFSRRLRSEGIKYNLGRDAGSLEAYREALLAWDAEVASGIRLLCECHPGTVLEEPQRAAEFFRELDPDRFQVIVHAFLNPPEVLESWFRHLGPRITHVHVQAVDADDPKGRRVLLDRQPAAARTALRIMRDNGFQGSFTLEFTEGTSTPGENMEDLFQAALRDLHFLREHWSDRP